MRLAIPTFALVLFAFAVCSASAQTPADATAPIEAKKPAAKKVDAKKTDARKPVAKKSTPAQPAPTAIPRAPKVYTTGPPTLRDKDGNVIPTSPDAYPVDSALPKKK